MSLLCVLDAEEELMDRWHNESWIQSPLVIPVIVCVLGISLVAAVIWFIDGVKKYGCWLHRDREQD